MRAGIRIEGVEWHSRIEKDWYAATVFVDLLTFVYVAFFYQVCLYVIQCFCSGQQCTACPQSAKDKFPEEAAQVSRLLYALEQP